MFQRGAGCMGGMPVMAGMRHGLVCERDMGGAWGVLMRGVLMRGVMHRWGPGCAKGGQDAWVAHWW